MDLLVCAYPLYLTHQYYSNQKDVSTLPFLSVWWSTFGMITLAENYANVDGLPFYWILKTGIMLSLYSEDYRKWLTEHALSGATTAGNNLKNGAVKIVNENFPKLKEYIKFPSTSSQSGGWLSGWFGSGNGK